MPGKTAVFEAMPENAAVKALAELATDAKFDRNELTITVAGENIVAAAQAVKAAGYNFFEDLTAVDWYPQEPRFQLSYHIVSHTLKQRIRLAVRLDSAEPTLNVDHLGLALGKLLRARGLRPLRHQFRRPSPAHAHHDARELGGPSAAQGLSRRRLQVDIAGAKAPEFLLPASVGLKPDLSSTRIHRTK